MSRRGISVAFLLHFLLCGATALAQESPSSGDAIEPGPVPSETAQASEADPESATVLAPTAIEPRLDELATALARNQERLEELARETARPPGTRQQVQEIWEEVVDKSWARQLLEDLATDRISHVVGGLFGENSAGTQMRTMGICTLIMAALNLLSFFLKRGGKWSIYFGRTGVTLVCVYMVVLSGFALDLASSAPPSSPGSPGDEVDFAVLSDKIDDLGALLRKAPVAPSESAPATIVVDNGSVLDALERLSAGIHAAVAEEGSKTRQACKEIDDSFLWYFPVWVGSLAAILAAVLLLHREMRPWLRD